MSCLCASSGYRTHVTDLKSARAAQSYLSVSGSNPRRIHTWGPFRVWILRDYFSRGVREIFTIPATKNDLSKLRPPMRLIICKEYKIFITSFPRLAGTMRTTRTSNDARPNLHASRRSPEQAEERIQQHAAERPLRRNSFSGPVQPPSFIFGQSTGLGRLFRASNSAADSSSRCRDVQTTRL